jgi:hypothetical protein
VLSIWTLKGGIERKLVESYIMGNFVTLIYANIIRIIKSRGLEM